MGKVHAIESLTDAETILVPSDFSLKIVRLSYGPEADPAQFLNAIAENRRFSSNLLSYVNSVANVAAPPILSIAEAVHRTGTQTAANLALFLSLLAQYRQGDCPQFDYQRFWQKALFIGTAARAMAAVHKTDSNILFTYGILAEVGQLALATTHPKDYGQLLIQDFPFDKRVQEERKLFGYTSPELTRKLLAKWGIQRQYAEAIKQEKNSSNYQKTFDERVKISQILKFATLISRISFLKLPLSETFIKAEREAADLSISAEQFGPFFDQLIVSWQMTSELFKIPTVHCPNYLQIKTIDDAAMEINLNKPPPLTFLVADDDPLTLISLGNILAKGNRVLFTAVDGKQALKMALEHCPHVLITNWRMPGLNGIDLCKILRKTKVTQHIYIIMLTCNETEDELVQAFDAGADDYVIKPFAPKVLQARISSGERLVLHQQTIHHEREKIQRYAVRLASANRKLQNMAMTDFLTGLTNRRNALLKLKNLVAEVKRYGEPLSCLMIDIDHFKNINDNYGHDCGDNVLKQLSRLLEEKARSYDTVSRWGGEEFLIICARSGPTDSLQLAERLRQTIEQYSIRLSDEVETSVTISIGVATWSADLQNEDELIKEADNSLYLAKKNGRNRVESSFDSRLSTLCFKGHLI